jgi:hypothetical protein
MKTIAILTLTLCLTSCASLDSLLLEKSGLVDDPTTQVDESIAGVNNLVKGGLAIAEPVASTIPFGSMIVGAVGALTTAYANVRKNRYKGAAKVAAITIESLASTDAGKEVIGLAKTQASKLADRHGVAKELHNIVKEIS